MSLKAVVYVPLRRIGSASPQPHPLITHELLKGIEYVLVSAWTGIDARMLRAITNSGVWTGAWGARGYSVSATNGGGSSVLVDKTAAITWEAFTITLTHN